MNKRLGASVQDVLAWNERLMLNCPTPTHLYAVLKRIEVVAGSNKWFTYTSDNAEQWALKGDESNIEGVMGAVGAGAPAGVLFKTPKNMRERFAVFGNAAGTRQIKVPVLTQTVYNALDAASTIPDIDGTGTLSFIRKRPELIRDTPTIFDTGEDDGDN